jgi:dienelactone hydrolase
VMKFDDGSDVKTPADWPRRRAEILKFWHGAMGEWPALLEKPRTKDESSEHVENFTRRKLQLETADGKFQQAYLHVPDGKGPFPALIVVFYDAESGAGLAKERIGTVDWGAQFSRRGFVTLSLGASPAGPTTVQRLSWLAFSTANANTWLRSQPEVDPARVGIIGHSFGGKWAMFSSCLDERFACAVWCDPGVVWNEKDPNANYWEPWYLGYDASLPKQRKEGIPTDIKPRTGPYKQLVTTGHDLNELHALMAPRPVLVSGGGQDRLEHWPALNDFIALNKFLGYETRVAMTQRNGHRPTPESNAQVIAFFEHFLREDAAGK